MTSELDIRVQALLDQTWMEMEEWVPDLLRLCQTGVATDEHDIIIIRKSLAMILDGALRRRDQRKDFP